MEERIIQHCNNIVMVTIMVFIIMVTIMVFIIDHLVEGGKDRELIMTSSTKGPSMVEVYWECVVSCIRIIIRIQDSG